MSGEGNGGGGGAKVISLTVVEPERGTPNTHAISRLRRALRKARAGEIETLVMFARDADGVLTLHDLVLGDVDHGMELILADLVLTQQIVGQAVLQSASDAPDGPDEGDDAADDEEE